MSSAGRPVNFLCYRPGLVLLRYSETRTEPSFPDSSLSLSRRTLHCMVCIDSITLTVALGGLHVCGRELLCPGLPSSTNVCERSTRPTATVYNLQYFPLTISHKAGVARLLESHQNQNKSTNRDESARPHTHIHTERRRGIRAALFSTLLFYCRFFSPQPCSRPLSLASLENSNSLRRTPVGFGVTHT